MLYKTISALKVICPSCAYREIRNCVKQFAMREGWGLCDSFKFCKETQFLCYSDLVLVLDMGVC